MQKMINKLVDESSSPTDQKIMEAIVKDEEQKLLDEKANESHFAMNTSLSRFNKIE